MSDRLRQRGKKISAAKLRAQRDGASPMGKAIIDRALELGLTLGEIREELGVCGGTMSMCVSRRGHYPKPRLRKALATFLGQPLVEVERLLQPRGKRVDRCRRCDQAVVRKRSGRKRQTGLCISCYLALRRAAGQVVLTCAYCGQEFYRRRSQNRGLFSFCTREHHFLWLRGRRRPRPRSRAGWGTRKRGRLRGRRAVLLRRSAELPSDEAIARTIGVAESTVTRARTGRTKPTMWVRFRLERAGVLPKRDRPALAETILGFCQERGITPSELARKAGINVNTMDGLLRRGKGAAPSTIDRLAPCMDCRPEDLIAACAPRLYRTPRKVASTLFNVAVRDGRQPQVNLILQRVGELLPGSDLGPMRRYLERRLKDWREPGRPRSYTEAEAREARRLRDEEGVSWVEIGQRMGWPVKKRDCPKAHRAYASSF